MIFMIGCKKCGFTAVRKFDPDKFFNYCCPVCKSSVTKIFKGGKELAKLRFFV